MKKIAFSSVALAIVVIALLPTRALALGGCVDSPEEPTLALGLLGIGAAAATYLKARFGRK